MPMLQRTPRKLLRQVANRPHAVDNSHNETAGIPSNPEKPTVDLAADPVSSSDEKAPILSSSPPPAQYGPPTRYGGRRVGIPKRGVFSSNTARKEQESAEDGAKGIDNRESGLPKEKSAGGTDSYDGSGGLDDFGEMAGPPSKKRKQNYTANVHASARPAMLGSFSKTYGRESTNGFKQPPSKLEAEKKKPTSFKVPNLYPLTQAKIASNTMDFKNPAPTSDSGSSIAVSDDVEVPNKKRPQNTETSYEEDTFDPAPCATSKREWRNIRQQAQDSSENTLSASNIKSSKTRKSLGLRKPTVISKSPKKDAKKGSNGSSTSSESGSTKLGFRMPAPLNTSGHSLSNPSSPKRFKQPNLHPNSSGSSSPLSSPPSSIFSQPPPRPDSPPQDPHCPLCRSPVSGDHLFAFQVDHPRMNVRMQAKFCREHKKRSAEATYIQRGYPRIAWPQLDQRLQRHYPLLERVLAGAAPSHFRARLADKVARGADRTLLGAIMTDDFKASTTGYYGARGARVLMERVTAAFAAELRQRAPSDKLIAAGGVGQFVQEVLVPELVTLLVMEDMGVEEERAREILKESGAVGDLVHEEEDDAVRRGSDGRVVVVVPEGWDGDEDEDEDGEGEGVEGDEEGV